jgi:hypothetical protein
LSGPNCHKIGPPGPSPCWLELRANSECILTSQERQYQLDNLCEKLQSWPWALTFDESLVSVVELASGRIDLGMALELSCLKVPAS